MKTARFAGSSVKMCRSTVSAGRPVAASTVGASLGRRLAVGDAPGLETRRVGQERRIRRVGRQRRRSRHRARAAGPRTAPGTFVRRLAARLCGTGAIGGRRRARMPAAGSSTEAGGAAATWLAAAAGACASRSMKKSTTRRSWRAGSRSRSARPAGGGPRARSGTPPCSARSGAGARSRTCAARRG